MSHNASPEERGMRDAVAAHLRKLLPGARIVHELVVGGCRADLAAVETERVTIFEIKSAKDTLKRLDNQLTQFSRAAHVTILVADIKWFDREPYKQSGQPRLAGREEWRVADGVWCYPEPTHEEYPLTGSFYTWRLPRPSLSQPHAHRLLNLLWRDECAVEAHKHRVSIGPRTRQSDIIEAMAYHMTGQEIAKAVCRQLRQRRFPEADAPVMEAA